MSRVSTHSKFQFDSVVEYKVEAIFSQKKPAIVAKSSLIHCKQLYQKLS